MNLAINYQNIYELFSNSSLILGKSTINFVKEINANIPNSFGVYIFYKNSKSYENIIYIGKAGEITTSGDKKSQGLQKRLTNIRDNKSANIYYKDIFAFLNLNELIIEYFETDEKFIPTFVEACLIQEYYLNNNRLPSLNKSF
ncbi:hypothetical protein N5T98_02375 [Aliarcobacter cryaerophilus]|uniref:hypothetical protein n=1 Tax=Aliarcobacter cryaerophilus TaxID=28198 RepID=UPI0021B66A15|nr:hypothetical protein [Aliarcobacter cryaerophilus]MCT7485904.1 hypothetical protein [Aliarcobacter cryaerophilus]MCT7489938.1 hypothetical protein [Aliarcobacter cryaerophilus]